MCSFCVCTIEGSFQVNFKGNELRLQLASVFQGYLNCDVEGRVVVVPGSSKALQN